MTVFIEQTMYTDTQAQIPAGFCDLCGGELYAPSLICVRCERNGL